MAKGVQTAAGENTKEEYMTRAECIIRIAFAVCAGLIGCGFVSGYHGIMYHNYVVHGDFELPAITNLMTSLVPWAYAIPLLAIILGIVLAWRKERNRIAVLLLTQICWLFALGWPLLCILAWQLPFIILMGQGG